MERAAINEESFAHMQYNFVGSSGNSTASTFYNDRFELFVPMPWNDHLSQVVVVAGDWEARRAMLFQFAIAFIRKHAAF